MKWAYSITYKFRVAALLAIIFFLMLGKNMVERSNATELRNSFSAVYEDRLIAEAYIYHLSQQLYQKKMLHDNCNNDVQAIAAQSDIRLRNNAISTIIHDYEKTKLTKSEAYYFANLKDNLGRMSALETMSLNARSSEEMLRMKELLNAQFVDAFNTLSKLSGIQLAEGKALNDSSRKIIAGSSLLSDFEIAILIGIGLMIQMLILASKSIVRKMPHTPSLN